MFNGKNFKVTMFGESGSCKTSVLTHLLLNKTLQNVGSSNNIYLTLENLEDKEFVKSSNAVMENFFKPEIPIPNNARSKPRNIFSQFPLFTYPTQNDRTFTLSVKDASRKNTLQKIDFYDFSGNILHKQTATKAERKESEEISRKVKEADVIVFTVDCVKCMEKLSYSNDAIFLLNALAELEKSDPKHEKMIIIVPTKFEKYYHKFSRDLSYNENDYSTFNKLMSNVRTMLAPLLDWLGDPTRRAHYEVSILPVLTLGNIDFFAYLSNYGTELTLDSSGQQYFQYYNRMLLDSNIEFDANKLPNYEPMYNEYPLSMILIYLIDKIISAKYKKLSQCSAFKNKQLSEVKETLKKALEVSVSHYPHTIVQSKLVK